MAKKKAATKRAAKIKKRKDAQPRKHTSIDNYGDSGV